MTAVKAENLSAESAPKKSHAPRYVFLDGLRGLAAFLIVLFHLINQWVSPISEQMQRILPHWLRAFINNCDLGVEVFFVLSGFVIVHSLVGETITPKYFGNFVLRRTLRLGPPYWFMVAWRYLVPFLIYPTKLFAFPDGSWPGWFATTGGWPNVFYNIAFLPDILGTVRMVEVSWTIFLEVQFYLFFLLVIAIVQNIAKMPNRAAAKSIITIIFTALAAYSLYRWFFMHKPNGGQIEDFPSRWYVFFTGALVYWATKKIVPKWSAWVFVAIVAALSIAMQERRGGATAACGAIMLIACDLGKQGTWLSWSPIQYLAKISYSLFLIHIPVGCGVAAAIQKFGDNSTTNILTAFFIGIGMSIIAADLMYRWIELPSLEVVKKLKPKKKPLPAP